jgi:small-conductance mechanosensitive channel
MRKEQFELAVFFLTIAIGAVLAVISPAILDYVGRNAASYAIYLRAFFIAVFGYLAVRLLGSMILSYGKGKPRMDERSLSNVVNLIGYIMILILLLALFNLNLGGLLVGAGFLGIVVGLASQTTLGNFFSGIAMMAAKPFAEGDRITFSTWQYGMMPPSYAHHTMLPGYSGVIADIGLMYTRIKLDDGPVTFVPNSIINQAIIMNYSISDIKDVIVRVELVKKRFEAFAEEVSRRVQSDRKLSKLICGELDIRITDIGIGNYGVTVRATVPVNSEAHVSSMLPAIILDISGKFQK